MTSIQHAQNQNRRNILLWVRVSFESQCDIHPATTEPVMAAIVEAVNIHTLTLAAILLL